MTVVENFYILEDINSTFQTPEIEKWEKIVLPSLPQRSLSESRALLFIKSHTPRAYKQVIVSSVGHRRLCVGSHIYFDSNNWRFQNNTYGLQVYFFDTFAQIVGSIRSCINYLQPLLTSVRMAVPVGFSL